MARSDVVLPTDPADLRDRPLSDGPLYLHFDADVVSREESPAQRYPAGGGPSTEVRPAVFPRPAATRRVAAVSLAAWNPARYTDGTSRAMGLRQTRVGELKL
jgi:arginase family enzyme